MLKFIGLEAEIHSSIIHKGQKMETTLFPSRDGWINKMQYVNTMEHYGVLKSNDITRHATT